MKYLFQNVLVIAAMSVALVGCEWTGGGDNNSWNDSTSIANFSGSYQANGDYLVSDYSSSSSTSTGSSTTVTSSGELNVLNEDKGTLSSPSFGGQCNLTPVKPGTVHLFLTGGANGQFTDDGAGNLSGTFTISGVPFPGSGTISYANGAYGMNLGPVGTAVNGSAITISYTVLTGGGGTTTTTGGTSSSSSPGSSGVSIYAFNVQQSGNKLSIIDNNGSVYSGSFGTVQTTGNLGAGTSGGGLVNGDQVIAPFSASGKSASGMFVNLTGNFQGTVAGVTTVSTTSGSTVSHQTSFALSSRVIMGTWIEDGGKTGDIKGISGSAANVTFSTSTSTNAP